MYRLVLTVLFATAALSAPLDDQKSESRDKRGFVGYSSPLAVAHAPLAVAHAPVAVAHAPLAVAHAPAAAFSTQSISIQHPLTVAHAPVAVAHSAPLTVAHAPLAVAHSAPLTVAHAPIATSALALPHTPILSHAPYAYSSSFDLSHAFL